MFTKLHYLIAALLGFLISVILLFPLFLNINSFYQDKGDYPTNGWFLWYNQYSITTGKIFNQKEYFNSTQFYPFPYSLAYSDHLFVPSLIFTPIFLLTQNLVFSVNAFVILTFILSFITSYILLFSLTKNKYSSIIGATIYTFNPITFAHFPGHLQLMNKYILPLVILFAINFCKKPNLKNGLLFFLFFTLNALTAVYFFVFSTIAVVIIFLTFIFSNNKSFLKLNFQYLINLFKYSLLGIIFLPILMYFYMPYLDFSKKEGVYRSLSDTILYSAGFSDWIFQNQDSLLYGKVVKYFEKYRVSNEMSELNYSEHTLSVNLIPLFLLILGLIYYIRNRNKEIFKEKNTMLLSFTFLLFATFLLSFGPIFSLGNFQIILPYYFLYENTDFFKSVRAPSRIQFIFYLPFIVFVSLGLNYLFAYISKNKKIYVFLFILLLIILENIHIRSFEEISKVMTDYKYIQTPIFSYLQNKVIFHIPSYSNDYTKEAKYLNWNTLTRGKILSGYSGYFPADSAMLLNNLQAEVNEKSIDTLKALEVDYILIHKKDISIKELRKLLRIEDLVKRGKIFEDSNLLIIDLKKYSLKTKICNRRRDLKLEFLSESHFVDYPGKTNYISYISPKLINKDDCILVNKYFDRYLESSTYINGKKTDHFFKLPLIVQPGEEVLLHPNFR